MESTLNLSCAEEFVGGRGNTRQVGGWSISLFERGRGDAVVLLHGSGPGVSAWSNWSPVIDRLAARFRVIAPDAAGFGLTTPTEPATDPGLSTKHWVAQLVALLDVLEIEDAALVGNSFGGAIALATALRHPDRVRSLVLMGTPVGAFEQTEGLAAGWHYEPSPQAMASVLRLFPHDPSAVTEEMVQTRYRLSARPGAQDAFRRLIPEPKGVGTVVQGIPVERIGGITQPTLVLHGREDRVIPLELGLRLHQAIPDSELHVFGKCGHWVQIERTDDFVRLVTDFLTVGQGAR